VGLYALDDGNIQIYRNGYLAGKSMESPREYRVEIVDQETVNRFVPLRHARFVRPGQVRFLKQSIVKEGIKEPLTVNEIEALWRTIDGWHRVTSIRELFAEGLRKIEVPLIVYAHLEEEEELHLHELLNTAVRHTSNDFLTVHQDEIPIIGMLAQRGIRFSLSGKGDTEGFRMFDLISAYVSRSLGRVIRGRGLLEPAKKLGLNDASEIEEFARFFIEAFGAPMGSNLMNRTNFLLALGQVYWANKGKVEHSEMVRRLRKSSTDDVLRKPLLAGGVGEKAIRVAATRIIRNANRDETGVAFRSMRRKE